MVIISSILSVVCQAQKEAGLLLDFIGGYIYLPSFLSVLMYIAMSVHMAQVYVCVCNMCVSVEVQERCQESSASPPIEAGSLAYLRLASSTGPASQPVLRSLSYLCCSRAGVTGRPLCPRGFHWVLGVRTPIFTRALKCFIHSAISRSMVCFCTSSSMTESLDFINTGIVVTQRC